VSEQSFITDLQTLKESTSRYHKIWRNSFLKDVTAYCFTEVNLTDMTIWEDLVFFSSATILEEQF